MIFQYHVGNLRIPLKTIMLLLNQKYNISRIQVIQNELEYWANS